MLEIDNMVRIIGVGSKSGFSGVNENLFFTLNKRHTLIVVIEINRPSLWKYRNSLYCFRKVPGIVKYIHPRRVIMSDEVSYFRQRTVYSLVKKSEMCERSLKNKDGKFDLIFQTSWPPAIRTLPSKPHFLYIDFTKKMVEKEYPDFARFYTEKDKDIFYKMEKNTYHNATTIFTFSNQTKKSIVDDYGVNENKVHNVRFGVNLRKIPKYEKNYGDKKLLFVSTPQTFDLKGGNSILKSFEEIKSNVKDVQLQIVGTKLNLSNKDIFSRGYIEHSTLRNYYMDTSVVVMPTKMGGFQTILEGMAYRCPCIGGQSTCSEIIEDGKTGFTVDPCNHKELADKVIMLLEDENLMKKMGDAGKKRVEKYFMWDKVVEEMENQFIKICPDLQ